MLSTPTSPGHLFSYDTRISLSLSSSFSALTLYFIFWSKTLTTAINSTTQIISWSYADGFNLITSNKRLLIQINNLAMSMNVKLEPSKCCSFFIVCGTPKANLFKFTVCDSPLTALFGKPHKYLSSVISHSDSTTATFNFISKKTIITACLYWLIPCLPNSNLKSIPLMPTLSSFSFHCP